jgi:hypothetical protein
MKLNKYSWPKNETLVFVRPPIEEYHGNLDNFYDPDSFPELNILKENWTVIRDEVLNYENSYGNLSGTSVKSPADVTGAWTVKYLKSFDRVNYENQKAFPKTTAIVNSIKNSVFASISILSPNTEIKPHYGDTNGIVRVHLALIIPEPYPKCAIRVNEEEMGWKEGELISFINVQKHEVWNRTNRRRYVLMVDIVPNELASIRNEICYKGLGSQSFIYLYNNISLIRILPNFSYDLLCTIFSFMWKVYLPFQKRLKFLP